MKTSWFNRSISFITDKWLLILIYSFLSLTLWLSNKYFSGNQQTVLNGLFMINASALAVILAIHNYHAEQRTARLQQVYFEDTLLGQAKSIEDIISQTNRNHQLAKKWFSYSGLIFQAETLLTDVKSEKNFAANDLANTLKNINFSINTTDFKKQTILKLFVTASMDGFYLLDWIKQIEEDAYDFYSYVKLLIHPIEKYLDKQEFILSDFLALNEKALKYLENDYILIKRHYILFHLFSLIVLEFSSENYSSQDKINMGLLKPNIKKLIQLLNKSYLDLIDQYKDTRIGILSVQTGIEINSCIQQVTKSNLIALS